MCGKKYQSEFRYIELYTLVVDKVYLRWWKYTAICNNLGTHRLKRCECT